MMEKLAPAGEGGGACPHPFTLITYKVAVYAPAEWADTLTLFHLYLYMYSVVLYTRILNAGMGSQEGRGAPDR